MNEKNKNEFLLWLKTLALFIWAIATIATCAGVWNYCPKAFIKGVAIVLFLANGYAVYRKFVLLKKSE